MYHSDSLYPTSVSGNGQWTAAGAGGSLLLAIGQNTTGFSQTTYDWRSAANTQPLDVGCAITSFIASGTPPLKLRAGERIPLVTLVIDAILVGGGGSDSFNVSMGSGLGLSNLGNNSFTSTSHAYRLLD